MKKLITAFLIALGIYAASMYNVEVKISPNSAAACGEVNGDC